MDGKKEGGIDSKVFWDRWELKNMNKGRRKKESDRERIKNKHVYVLLINKNKSDPYK